MASLSIESEIVRLVKAVSAFNLPVCNGFNPVRLITDPQVIARLTYGSGPSDLLKSGFVPYLSWTGPFNYDKGQTADDDSGTKKADFWFWCSTYCSTDAMMWVNEIEAALSALSFPYNLDQCRLTAALFIDKHPIQDNQKMRTAQEFSASQACIGYTFGYQRA